MPRCPKFSSCHEVVSWEPDKRNSWLENFQTSLRASQKNDLQTQRHHSFYQCIPLEPTYLSESALDHRLCRTTRRSTAHYKRTAYRATASDSRCSGTAPAFGSVHPELLWHLQFYAAFPWELVLPLWFQSDNSFCIWQMISSVAKNMDVWQSTSKCVHGKLI